MPEQASWPLDPAIERYVSVATYRRSGEEVCTPVWLAKVDANYYLFSEGKAGKVKRIRANGRARIAACDLRGRVSSGWSRSDGGCFPRQSFRAAQLTRQVS